MWGLSYFFQFFSLRKSDFFSRVRKSGTSRGSPPKIGPIFSIKNIRAAAQKILGTPLGNKQLHAAADVMPGCRDNVWRSCSTNLPELSHIFFNFIGHTGSPLQNGSKVEKVEKPPLFPTFPSLTTRVADTQMIFRRATIGVFSLYSSAEEPCIFFNFI
jgi:hypothetical protein